ncbi:MAG TPA: short-chain dehydrogenase [Chloroflexi bacterium]|nr:short-chain dehydrogenase [Chloroflexota bacterium]
MNKLTKKVALITGGGGGLGKAAAMKFASKGSKVLVADINYDDASKVADIIGGDALAVKCDVTLIEECRYMVDYVIEQYGRLDIVFANAGIGGANSEFVSLDIDEWDRVFDINLRGMMLTCKVSVPHLIESGGGAIVLMGSSTGGWDTIRGSGAYMASKEAVKALGRSLALELGKYNIRVNVICPGIIETDLSFRQGAIDGRDQQSFFKKFADRIPLGRVGQAEDVANAVAFLASDDARHITGSTLLIDGGQTLQSWSNAPDEKNSLYE